MFSIKTWLIGSVLVGLVGLASPTLRAKLRAGLQNLKRRAYAWLFLRAPGILLSMLSYNNLTAEQQAMILDALRHIIYYLVRIEEILLPDTGLGEQKKASVMAKLKLLALPDSLAALAASLIDDAVRVMNEEAQAALAEHKPEDEINAR